jgi:hypothetical protein
LQTITQNIVKCYLWKVKEKVGGVFDDRALLAEFASWVLELSCVDQFATLVALISPSIRVRTQRAFSLHKTVCQKPVATFAQKLLHGFSQGEPILVQLQKQVLTNPKKIKLHWFKSESHFKKLLTRFGFDGTYDQSNQSQC